MSDIGKLFFKRFASRLSPDEAAEIKRWEELGESRLRLSRRLADPGALGEEYRLRRLIDTDRAEADMMRRIRELHRPARRRRLIGLSVSVAAVMVLGLFIFHSVTRMPAPGREPELTVVAEKTLDDIKPGRSKALLSDGSGPVIELESSEEDIHVAETLAVADIRAGDEEKVLCLDIPRGCEFKIILEDSTEVWLNSDSRLRYPQKFGADERRVQVSGEAYFSVSKDSERPFYVEADGQLIRVYGTTFNVRNYPDDDAVYTTLESGSIALSLIGNPAGEIMLSPCHQAMFDRERHEVTMRTVDPGVITGWRHGRFIFEEQPLAAIMRDLSRWYDFDYRFADPSLETLVFMGSIPRYAEFQTAIQILENCGDIAFSIVDGVIVVSKRQS